MAAFLPRCICTVVRSCSSPLTRTSTWQHQALKSIFSPETSSRNIFQSAVRRRDHRRRVKAAVSRSTDLSVQVLVEGEPDIAKSDFNHIMDTIDYDSRAILHQALMQEGKDTGALSRPTELSIVLCDDSYMRALNLEWRGKDATTDVLSFELPADDFSDDFPVRVLGDVVISLEQAERQAAERRGAALHAGAYSLQDEVRVLLVHGVLHLIGFDHELSSVAAAVMGREEARIMAALAWKGAGLLEASGVGVDAGAEEGEGMDGADASGSGSDREDDGTYELVNPIHVVCLDMDGTLLNSSSQISSSTAEAVRRCLARSDRTLMLATGKARPAAIAACKVAGLAGPGMLVHEHGPGIFLQGLAVYDRTGALLPGSCLPHAVVRTCFEYAAARGVACVAFLGDTCVTLRMTPELRELHERYYEPLAEVAPSLDDILMGPAVKKIILMADEARVDDELIPHFEACMDGTGAELCQAVPTMLEFVPEGVDKWTGLQQFLAHAGLDSENVMAIGDGMNDYELLANVGFGVAMSNAVDDVLEIADYTTASNDEDGVAHALSKFLR